MAFSAHKDKELIKEHLDAQDVLEKKLNHLADLVRNSRHMVAFTGAGISTSAGIPDFRGPQGVWTLQAQGKQRTDPTVEVTRACCTPTHMSLVRLEQEGILKHLISQNCDGLHRKSGFNPSKLSELHGNTNIEECEACSTRFFRDYECDRLDFASDHFTGRYCVLCGGRLLEWTVDFDQQLPQDMLDAGFLHSRKADLHLALGSSLTVSPACDMPKVAGRSRDAHLVIVNLQHTPLDNLCSLRIYAKTDVVMKGLMKRLGLDIPRWKINRKILFSRSTVFETGEVNATAIESNQTTLVVQGVDSFQDHLPASLFKSVTIAGETRTEEPMHFTLPNVAADDKVAIRMEWHGHYDEPDFEFSLQPATLPSLFYLGLSYDPFDQEWRHEEPVPVSEKNVRLPESLWKAPGKCQSGRFLEDENPGNWSSADLTVFQGRLAIAVLGGTRGSHILVDPISLQVIPKGYASRTDKMQAFIDTKRWGHSVTRAHSTSSQLLVFGGWNDTDQFNDMWVYNPNEKISVKLIRAKSRKKPRPRALHNACMNGKSLYIFGGISRADDNRYQFHNDLWRFRRSKGMWQLMETKGTPPCPRAQHAQVAVGQFMFVLGGMDYAQTFEDMYVCDTKTLEWRRCCEKVPGLTARFLDQRAVSLPKLRPTLSCVGTHLLAMVSEEGLHTFDTRTEAWSKKPYGECPQIVAHAVANQGNTLYLIGGEQNKGGRVVHHDISKIYLY